MAESGYGWQFSVRVNLFYVRICLMNWDQMKKNLHARVQLKPTAHRLDEYGARCLLLKTIG